MEIVGEKGRKGERKGGRTARGTLLLYRTVIISSSSIISRLVAGSSRGDAGAEDSGASSFMKTNVPGQRIKSYSTAEET